MNVMFITQFNKSVAISKKADRTTYIGYNVRIQKLTSCRN